MAAVETALAVSQRIGGGLHIAQIIVGPFVKIPDHLQIVVQYLIEISALGTGFCQNHRKMQAHGTDIEAPHKYGFILVVCRMHAAPLIPGA